MKDYESPSVVSMGVGESVYMASGSVEESCWEVSVGEGITTTQWYKHFPLIFTHTGAHEMKDPIVTIVFNQNVNGANINNVQVIGSTISVNGDTVVARYPSKPPVDPWVNVWTNDQSVLSSVDIVSVSAVCE